MQSEADVCLIVEGGYPYIVGGVAFWMDAFMRASPGLKFHVISISISSQPKVRKFSIPDNLVGTTDVILDACPAGRVPTRRDSELISTGVRRIQSTFAGDRDNGFALLVDLVRRTGFGQAALIDSKPGWVALEQVYRDLLPDAPFVDFFWAWRFLAQSLLTIISTPLPHARIFHAVSAGYAGLLGAYARQVTKRPYVVTEHGIYTNERRIELGIADWIFDSGAGGFAVGERPVALRDFWFNAFASLSQITYEFADVITTQYRANQDYQRLDGAPEHKLRIIPNGIDADVYAKIHRSTEPRPPTVLMIGRIVPIKDTRTFIMAMARLRELVPDVVAIMIGPEEEDPAYAKGCHELVAQLGLEATVQFLGRVRDVNAYLGQVDVIALTSISEAQPLALLEAAATGLPAVTTDVGSCRELIEGFEGDPVIGVGGIVVEACNPNAVAEALAAILGNDQMRADMGRIMQQRTLNLYHKDRVRRMYESLYASMNPQLSFANPQ
ncbi:MAG TPA: GT4 family glycosyltransferase PelF [Acetobacteraceae bacterium]|jgi:glycosyltransferase involved in cell wall biosynthesis|nr:GT4 family glycosyltransferase PelF [Acetobacteraceae bacterium]